MSITTLFRPAMSWSAFIAMIIARSIKVPTNQGSGKSRGISQERLIS